MFFLLALVLFVLGVAHADLASDVQQELDAEVGWRVMRTDSSTGIELSSKRIDAVGLTAFRGVVALSDAVDPVRLCAVLMDVVAHKTVTGGLDASVLMSQTPSSMTFYQVTKDPRTALTRRAWINLSEFDNVAEGRCHRTWQTLNPDDHPDAVAEIEHEFSSVVLVTVSHGSWSVREEPNRGLSLVYKTVVDPGGNVPPIAYNRAVSRMLPDNMMTFVNAAK